jgi:hypothetical protein
MKDENGNKIRSSMIELHKERIELEAMQDEINIKQNAFRLKRGRTLYVQRFEKADCGDGKHQWEAIDEGQTLPISIHDDDQVYVYTDDVEHNLGTMVVKDGQTNINTTFDAFRNCVFCGKHEIYSFEIKLIGQPVMSDPYADVREYQFDEDEEE